MTLPRLCLVLGGARSGKSRHAEALAHCDWVARQAPLGWGKQGMLERTQAALYQTLGRWGQADAAPARAGGRRHRATVLAPGWQSGLEAWQNAATSGPGRGRATFPVRGASAKCRQQGAVTWNNSPSGRRSISR